MSPFGNTATELSSVVESLTANGGPMADQAFVASEKRAIFAAATPPARANLPHQLCERGLGAAYGHMSRCIWL